MAISQTPATHSGKSLADPWATQTASHLCGATAQGDPAAGSSVGHSLEAAVVPPELQPAHATEVTRSATPSNQHAPALRSEPVRSFLFAGIMPLDHVSRVRSPPMNYRAPGDSRSYLCPGCASPGQGPPEGGPVECPRCRTAYTLPDRRALLASAGSIAPIDNDPARLAQLRVQDGRPRLMPPTLRSVLGGDGVQPGREQEAIAIWQSLRMRAQQGDVSASEDLAYLTALIVQLPGTKQQPGLAQALSESAYDASVLPRHKQESLGRLVRMAVAAGDLARAHRYLSWMIPNAPELQTDSDLRISAAVVATMERDPQRVLSLVGPQKDAIPIADQLDPLASVLRANAYEAMGNLQSAAQILRELPDPRMLGLVQSSFEALQLCRQSGGSYQAVASQQAAQRAASGAGSVGKIVGGMLVFMGIITIVSGALPALLTGRGLSLDDIGTLITAGIGGTLVVVGVILLVGARTKGKHAAWLRTNGVSLTARIINAQRTGTRINNVNMYRFTLQVAGPQGPYASSFTRLAPDHEVAAVVGREVRVRADPRKLEDVVLED